MSFFLELKITTKSNLAEDKLIAGKDTVFGIEVVRIRDISWVLTDDDGEVYLVLFSYFC